MFVYVAQRTAPASAGRAGQIHVFRADASDTDWRCVQREPVAECPTAFIARPDGRLLYGLQADGLSVSAFARACQTGHVRLINRLPLGGLHPAGGALTHDGRFFLIALAGSGHVALVTLARDGALRHVAQRLLLPAGARPRHVAVDPSGRFAIVADPGANGLHVLRFDAPHAWLSPHQFLRARPGDLPDRVAFHPRLPVLYVGNHGNATVTAYHWHAAAGRVSFAQAIRTVPVTWSAPNAVADIGFSRDGRRLYGLNRGHGSVAMLAIQPGKGKMFVRARDATGGQEPDALAWDATGETLLIAHGQAGGITRFAVTVVNGTLSRVQPDVPFSGAVAVVA